MTKEFDLNNNQSKNNAFSGDALNISDLTPTEQEVYNMMPEILAFETALTENLGRQAAYYLRKGGKKNA